VVVGDWISKWTQLLKHKQFICFITLFPKFSLNAETHIKGHMDSNNKLWIVDIWHLN